MANALADFLVTAFPAVPWTYNLAGLLGTIGTLATYLVPMAVAVLALHRFSSEV